MHFLERDAIPRHVCYCEAGRAKQSLTLLQIAHLHCTERSAAQVSAEDHRLAKTLGVFISGL